MRKVLILGGALVVLLPPAVTGQQRGSADTYVPLHAGSVSLGTGLYIRRHDDLIVPGTPPLILRRTYRSRDPIHRPFGIGTTHPGEAFVVGDSTTFQWLAVVLADGVQIEFRRISEGTSLRNAVFEHRTSPSEYYGARMEWTGFNWTMRLADSSQWTFQACGAPHVVRPCGLIFSRDAGGHAVHYWRDPLGRLVRMGASPDRWIGFDYDEQHQIVRAYTSRHDEVRYSYDDGGRLTLAKSSDGTERKYTYSARHEMLTIAQPDMSIENFYDAAGLAIKQITRFPDRRAPFVFDMRYETEGDRIVRADVRRSDGSWRTLQYNQSRYVISDASGAPGVTQETITYERDPDTNSVLAVTLTCSDGLGVARTYRRPVSGSAESTLNDMRRTHCSSSELGLPR